LHPVVCFTFARECDLISLARRFGTTILAAGRQTKAILIRGEREARPCFEVARDFRTLELKTTQALPACNENRECPHAT
jgi:hypothetical protein